jgi:Putative peptidoglycan binding domain
MKSIDIAKSGTLLSILVALTGCSTWHSMDKTEGTVAGAAGGAVAGAVVGGPVGAVVGGVGGGFAGNEVAGKEPTASASTSSSSSATATSRYESGLVRNVQQALNDKGYNPGPMDGQWGPATEDAVRKFQRASGLPDTGQLEPPTLNALGVAPRM